MQDDWRYRCYVEGMMDQINNHTPDYEDIPECEKDILEMFNIHDLLESCESLSKKQKYIIERRYCYGDTFQAIADYYKCSKVYIFNQHKSALAKLKIYLGEHYAI